MRAIVRAIMKRIGYKAHVLVVNDALVALEAGAPGQPGVVIISGTGSISYGRNAHGEAARSGGWGYVLGDEGSGYWIGRGALRAVLREADQRGPKTVLTPLLLDHFGVGQAAGPHPRGLPHQPASRRRSARSRSASRRAFSEGDQVAIGILRGAANELESSAHVGGPAARTGRAGVPVHPRRAASSARCPWLEEELTRRLPVVAPRRTVRLLDGNRRRGAVALALQEARGGVVDPALQDRLMPLRHEDLDLPGRATTSPGALAAHVADALAREAVARARAARPGARRSCCTTSWCGSLASGEADFSQATTFNLDEFLGIPADRIRAAIAASCSDTSSIT